MAKLSFGDKINLTESPHNINPKLVRNLCMVNEPNNELVQYYIHNNLAEDKSTNIIYNNYTSADWGNKKKRLTVRSVSRIGVKAFPGIGAIGFFKYLDGRSMILCPVNNNDLVKEDAPTLSMMEDGDNLIFTIQPPQDNEYTCYRIVLENLQFALEYITYELTTVIPKPDVNGTYSIYCIGYKNEGETISYNSNLLSFVVENGRQSFEPKDTDNFYTKAQIDAMVSQIGELLDKLNGEVI